MLEREVQEFLDRFNEAVDMEAELRIDTDWYQIREYHYPFRPPHLYRFQGWNGKFLSLEYDPDDLEGLAIQLKELKKGN